ncbi:MAG: nuclear transport factor 2 family protein [Bacteroidota bacterium]
MKKICLIIVLFWGSYLQAQTAADSTGIRTAATDYVEGFYTADTVRMKNGLSDELVKRIIDNRGGKSTINTIGRKELIGYVNPAYKMPDPNPTEPFKATVTIYDIKNGIALAKVTSNKMPEFFDYVQVGQLNGEWKIINVLWGFS